ncbi:solute carrier family 46 member 3-like [Haliotis rubra]|uniref:solute carrier family 46 member 3-like n=1 Tax=Haliotis rubra TaxID=36100 RepID=UPI001EE54055|nr:solute carrier family 46 member 3-like [Haliotis rubra]
MESTPLLGNNDKEEKSKLGNLLKANLVFLAFHLAINVRNPLLTQYLYKRYYDEEFDNSTGSTNTPNQTSKCYVNESDPGYMLQERVQEKTSDIQTLITVIGSSGALVSCMFLGAYSDFLGRRFLFIVPLVGLVLKFWLFSGVIYWNLDLSYMYIGEVFEGISGGYNGVILASYAYTADNTPPKNSRTVGIALIDFTTYLATAASQVITGYFIKDLVVLPNGIAAPLLPALRAVMSRMAPPEMQGSLFAGIGLVNIISSGTGVTVFNEMYNATVKMLRGFVFFVCAGCQLLAGVIIVVFLYTSRSVPDKDSSAVVINDSNWKPDPIVTKDKSITDTTM